MVDKIRFGAEKYGKDYYIIYSKQEDGELIYYTSEGVLAIIQNLENRIKELEMKYTVDHCNCENLRLEVQRLENENEQLKSDYTQLQEEWISSDKEVERLKEELRLALN